MNKKNITAKQNLLIQSLEGIGDILVYEAKRQKNKLVLDGLQMISDSVKKIFNIQKSEPERFEQLVVSQDFLELYQKDKEEAQLRLTFDPEKYLISFSTAINQIIRIYESAIETQNKEVSRFAVYHINWILKALAFEKDNRLFIEQILRKLAQITRTAIKNNDDSAYSAAIHWYTDIVFNRFTQSKFQLSYIDLFDKYFFANINYIVSQNQESLFHALVSSLIDGVDFSYYDRGKIWDYGHIILEDDLQKYNKLDKEYGIEKRIRELAHSENELDTKEKLDSWLDKLDELKEIIETNLTDSQTKEAKELEKKVRDFSISQFKYNNLLEVVFAIGAYCLFKQKPSLIKHLWQYKQPPDSDAHWIGHDIIPETLNQVIQFYLRKELFERKLNFLEGHHGSEVYYKKYFLLLLARVLQNIRSYENDDKYPQIEDYQLPDLNIYRLSDLGDSADEFIQLADSLKNEKNLLFELGFDVGKIDELFDKKLISFLQKIKIESNKQISAKHKKEKISPNKVEEFKEDVLKSFHKVVIMRDIFVNYLKSFENKLEEDYEDTGHRFGVNTVDDKASFFEEWNVHYVGWGENYGRDLAFNEDSYLLEQISNQCDEIEQNEFDDVLEKIENPKNIILFATNVSLWEFFENSENYKPKWHKNADKLDVKGFSGWYELKGESIPVFQTHHRIIDKQILILNKEKSGKLIQHSPLNKGENKALVRDIFYINIQTFSNNSKLMEEFIKKPPEWLKNIGSEQEQRDHLEESALIHIFERFEYNKPKDFEGYKLTLKD